MSEISKSGNTGEDLKGYVASDLLSAALLLAYLLNPF